MQAIRAAILAATTAIPLTAQGTAGEAPIEPLPAAQEPARAPVLEIPGIERLRIGGEYRLRYENRIDYGFDSGTARDDDFFTQRARLDLDLTLNDRLGFFLQVQDARFFGEEAGSTTARESPGLDLHQVFLDVRDVPLSGGDLRVGRQVLSYGEQRLIGALDWLSQGRSFDGLRMRWSGDDRPTIDLFATQVREVVTTTATHDDAWFAGVYGTTDPSWNDATVDVYALVLHDEETAAGGRETRATLGVRGRVAVERFELGTELATQFGEEDDTDIPIGETYALHLHARANLPGSRAPFLRADFDLASGDDPDSGDHERFDNLFPTGHAHLGIMDFALWENVMHAALSGGFEPTASSSLTLAWRWFRSVEETDRVVGPVGVLSPGGAGIANRLGQEIDLVWRNEFGGRTIRPYLEAGYGIFLPDDGVEDAFGDDDPAHFVYVQGGVRF